MKSRVTLIVAVGFAIVSCNRGHETGSSGEISGAYARVYSFKVVNPETGAEIGMRTIRDTIFIKHSETGYEVSNRKWRLNEYDMDGWQNMAHSDSRPIEAFTASFNNNSGSLTSESGQVLLFLDLQNNRLYSDSRHQIRYDKIR